MSKQQTRVALITIRDPNDMSSWSGTQYRLYQQLQKRFDVVDPLGPVELNALERFIVKVAHRFCSMMLTKYNKIHSLLLGYFRARHFNKKLRGKDYTFVFASACAPVAAFLDTEIPIVYLSDATFNLLLGYYDQFTGLNKLSVFEGEYAERNAIKNSAAVIMSSEWARQSAIKDYGASPDKVEVCLFGANVDDAAIKRAAENSPAKLERIGKQCNLLFLARDWQRKGGKVAVEAFAELKRQGYSVTLTVCGCEPDQPQDLDDLTVIPYLDKSLEEDRRRYYELMHDSHFLILPTVADCTPMVFAEANAYGMPVITAETGGIPSLINEGENGYLLSPDADGKAYADVIKREFFENPEGYRQVIHSARQRYETALTWDNWGQCSARFIERRLAEESSAVEAAARSREGA